MRYCQNDPCENEATHCYKTEDGAWFYLCATCKDAFELGQVNQEASAVPISEGETTNAALPY